MRKIKVYGMKKKDIIINFIKDKIDQGLWVEGTKIFSENQFIDYLGVSRNTVRSAVKQLEIEGILETKKGGGSFVKGFNLNKKKYILILTNEHVYYGDYRTTQRNLVEYLKEEVTKAGYKPYIYINSNTKTLIDNLSSILDDVAGIITLGLFDVEHKLFDSYNIPIVTTLRANATEYPSVMMDYVTYMKQFNYLIDKYKIENPLVFILYSDMISFYRGFWDGFTMYAVSQYFSKYKNIKFQIPRNKNYMKTGIKNLLNNIDFTPDGILFLDDNLFNFIKPYFKDYDNIFKNNKIITFTRKDTSLPEGYNICRIEMSLEEIAKNSVSLLKKIINREFIKKHNLYIASKIVDEENLEKS